MTENKLDEILEKMRKRSNPETVLYHTKLSIWANKIEAWADLIKAWADQIKIIYEAEREKEPLGHCCYGGLKRKSDCASCSAWLGDITPL